MIQLIKKNYKSQCKILANVRKEAKRLKDQGSILGPLLCLLDINDFLRTLNNISIPVLFADDARVFITNKKSMYLTLRYIPLFFFATVFIIYAHV